MTISRLHQARYAYIPRFPAILDEPVESVTVQQEQKNGSIANAKEIQPLFPHIYGKPVVHFVKGTAHIDNKSIRAGAILSGGQAPGGHNVIAGLYDGLKKANPNSRLFGFLGGPEGLVTGNAVELTGETIEKYRNTGGFDMIGSGRTKIETPEQINGAVETVKRMALDAVIIIGGDDSNTNAAVLSEYFLQNGIDTQIIGVPKTIDGDLKYDKVETSFGFDTATKIYSNLIGNIARDADSAKKYWHFIKLMGRFASHIALECALSTQPNICLISEEVAEKHMTLKQITDIIAAAVVKRAAQKKNFGIVLIPEGVIEFIPEMKQLIKELNAAMAQHTDTFNMLDTFKRQKAWIEQHISPESAALFASMPEDIAAEFLTARDPHGNLQVSRIETEHLLIGLTAQRLAELKKEGTYQGKFSAQAHFLGYEGRAEFPSNFDADYCYALGRTIFLLIANGLTGYLASVYNLTAPPAEWKPCGIPLTDLMDIELRSGKKQPVIKKTVVDLKGKPFKTFEAQRDQWAVETAYIFPGPVQYFGPSELCDTLSKTLLLEHEADAGTIHRTFESDSKPAKLSENLNDCYAWLDGFINFEKRPHKKAFTLEVVGAYAALLSNPQTAYKCVHIAGSKGKGSVAAMFSALLAEAGYKTGLYTSPHVNDFRERITENGRFFSDSAYLTAFRSLQKEVMSHINKKGYLQPSWFELVTLLSFILFHQNQLDWAVFETGMGGRLDATNIVQPDITLLTPIELEHCKYLGTMIPLIAAEKAGIIKENIPVFCSPQKDSALIVFKEQAAALNAPFFYLPDFIESITHRLIPQGREVDIRFSAEHPVGKLFKRPLHMVLPLFTPVQTENAALAAAAFKYRFPDISEEVIECGLSKAWLPGRFQLLSRNPLIVIDGAHTHNSIQACADTFFSLLGLDTTAPYSAAESGNTAPESRRTAAPLGSGTLPAYSGSFPIDNKPDSAKPILVFACAADKDPIGFAPIFLDKVSHVYLTIPGSFKKGDLEKTVGAFTKVFEKEKNIVMESSIDFNTILKKAFAQSYAENRPLLITGSFYLAGEAQRIYSEEGFQDQGTQY